MPLDRQRLIAALANLSGQPISFSGRPYLSDVINSSAECLVLRCARQTEKTTTICNLALTEAACDPDARILIIFPRGEQMRNFRDVRLAPTLKGSPALRVALLDGDKKVTATDWLLANGSHLYLRAAYRNADASRGLSATMVIFDEAQDLAPDAIPVICETMSHARHKRIIISGTPKLIQNPLEAAYARSSRKEWVVNCPKCRAECVPDERVLGLDGCVCPKCRTPISFAGGHWVSRNPDARYSDGYWISALAVPWRSYDDILRVQQEYSGPQFRNEILGLPSTTRDYMVTREDVLKLCSGRSNGLSPEAWRRLAVIPESLCLGIDWGGGTASCTAFALGGFSRDHKYHLLFVERLPVHADHDAALRRAGEILRQVPTAAVAADGVGFGAVLNRNLLAVQGIPAKCCWSVAYTGEGAFRAIDTRGPVMKWSVSRTTAVSNVMSFIKAGRITFPSAASGEHYLSDIWTEVAVYDRITHQLRYEPQPGTFDDVLDALAYSMLVSWKSLGHCAF